MGKRKYLYGAEFYASMFEEADKSPESWAGDSSYGEWTSEKILNEQRRESYLQKDIGRLYERWAGNYR